MPTLTYFEQKFQSILRISTKAEAEIADREIHIGDYLATMCAGFFHRQFEYARAVEQLIIGEQYASAATLARTMLEGTASLWWVTSSGHAHRRATTWKIFVITERLKAFSDPEDTINGYVSGNGQNDDHEANVYPVLFDKKGRRHDRWTIDETGRKVSAREVLESYLSSKDSQSSLALYPIYQGLSSFQHWGPSSFMLDRTDPNRWKVATRLEPFTINILILATTSLWHVAYMTAVHFDLKAMFGLTNFIRLPVPPPKKR